MINIVAGGARHIGDNPNGKRPTDYTRGELPKGEIIKESPQWAGNNMHGYRGRVVITQCQDGTWISFPQPTQPGDWASYKVDRSDPLNWVISRYEAIMSA
jgi:hypothetical protein